MTIAQGLREEGKREGILLGIEKGIEKGIFLSIEKMLKKGMTSKEIENILDVPHETVAKVKKESIKILKILSCVRY